MRTVYSCGIKINPIGVEEISSITEEWLSVGKKGLQITGVNLEQIALLSKNSKFADYINASDIVNIDGVIVSKYLKLKGYTACERTLCADILDTLLTNANQYNRSIFLLGATQDTIEILVDNIQHKYPNIRIVGFNNGFFSDEKVIVDKIAQESPDYLFIGMPSPFKERFITTYKDVRGVGICFGVGGMFDIMAGKVQRAPIRVQKMGLEWLYRITQNPIGHTKRVLRALLPCLSIFFKDLFSNKNQTL